MLIARRFAAAATASLLTAGALFTLLCSTAESQAKAGDGFLQRQGYTLAWSGWEGDITSGLRIALPVAVNADGSPISGRVRAEYILTAPNATVNITAQ